MMPSNNLAVLSCAGSGKTSEIVKMAASTPSGRSLLLTYTRNNAQEIRTRFYKTKGFIPANCDVITWYSFLLSHWVRPYQRQYRALRIDEIAWINGKSAIGIPKSNPSRYFFSPQGRIYRDKIAEFGVACDAASGGKVIKRLAQIYSTIYIDEFQDLTAWDLDIVELLLRSGIRTVIVGDHRQHILRTNDGPKYKKYRGEGILKRIDSWKGQGICKIENRNDNRRSCQTICDLADYVFPHSANMVSVSVGATGHDGVFVINSSAVSAYYATFSPAILRWDKRTECHGYGAMNFGESKGLGFDRVLIYPNGPIRKFLSQNDKGAISNARAKLYVGVTRARYSVAFVLDGTCTVPGIRLYHLMS